MDDWLYLENASSQTQIPAETDFISWITAALNHASASQKPIAIKLLNQQAMQAMNLQYRGIDKPTNVLSFPFTPLVQDQGELGWGDIAICAAIVEQEANDQQKSAQSHWAHLTIHGVLHLLGYDHNEPQDAAKMEPLEVSIMAQLGFENPYSADAA